MLDALEQALHERQPPGKGGLVYHSDRGSQCVSIRYTERLAEAGIGPSVGSVGDSYDNAFAETINGLFKAEVIHCQSWRTSKPSSLLLRFGSTGSTIDASSRPSAISRPPRPTPPTMPPLSPCSWPRRVSNQLVSSKPGAVHNAIERMFCRLKDYRRIATRYDNLATNFASSFCVVSVRSGFRLPTNLFDTRTDLYVPKAGQAAPHDGIAWWRI